MGIPVQELGRLTAHQAKERRHTLLAIKEKLHHFDAMCLTKVEELSPRQIKRIRTANNLSQDVFAHYLNVRSTLVSQWERGEKKPSGPSAKLLSLVKHKGLEAIA